MVVKPFVYAYLLRRKELKLKSRSVYFYRDTKQVNWVKATNVTTTTSSRPVHSIESFTVFADQLHGDHKTVYKHEFRKNFTGDYDGTLFRQDSVGTMTQTGMQGPFSHFVNAAGEVDENNMYNEALSDLLEKLRSNGVGSGLDLSVDIAEGRQVGKMLGDLTKLTRYVTSFHPKNWAKKWLEYQYGWRPLVQSVYGSFDALMHRRLNELYVVRGKSRRYVYSERNFQNVLWNGSKESVFHHGKYRYLLVAEYELKNTVKQQLSGYTSLNPVGIGWELLPYSFVVDWVYDIGGYLRNMEGALLFASGFKRGYSVYGYRSQQTGSVSGGGTASGVTNIGEATAFSYQSYKNRTPIGVFPFPRPPSFECNLGWQRCLSAGSLLSLHFGKGGSKPPRVI